MKLTDNAGLRRLQGVIKVAGHEVGIRQDVEADCCLRFLAKLLACQLAVLVAPQT